MEVPSPRLVPKPPASPGDENSLPGTETGTDNNPPEENSHDEELMPKRQQKRDDVIGLGFNNNNNNNKVAGTTSSSSFGENIIVDNTIIGDGGQTWSNSKPARSSSGDGDGGADDLIQMQMQYMAADRRIYNPGRPKNLETCEDEYLLERQVAPKKKYDTQGRSRSPD